MSAAPLESATAAADATGAGRDVLTVADLTVSVRDTTLVDGVDLTIGRGERVGLIGESGSGKSLTALAVMGLLPEDVRMTGSVRLAGVDHDLVGADERQMSRVRGPRRGDGVPGADDRAQPDHAGRRPGGRGHADPRAPGRTAAAPAPRPSSCSTRSGCPTPATRPAPTRTSSPAASASGSSLALALANDPALLVCDEPTTALDVTVQALVLDLIVRGVAARDAALLFITHDLAVVATVCQRVLVMYGGRVVEAGPVAEVFTRPRHRYTQGLLGASDLDVVDERGRLVTIAGSVPGAGRFPAGCVFRNRCPHATATCEQTPAWTGPDAAAGFACHHPAGTTADGEVGSRG